MDSETVTVRPERAMIRENMEAALRQTSGHVPSAATLLQVSPDVLYKRLRGVIPRYGQIARCRPS